MKYEQKVEVELQEYICLVKRIDGVVAQKSMEEELIRCKDCKHKNEYGYCTFYLNFHHLTTDMDYCSDAERKEE